MKGSTCAVVLGAALLALRGVADVREIIKPPTPPGSNPGIVEAVGTSRDEVFYAVTATSDGGVVGVGSITISSTTTQLLVVKFDYCGDQVWRYAYGGAGESVGRFVMETPGHDLVVGGYTNTEASDGTHGLLIVRLLSTGGTPTWTRAVMDDNRELEFWGYAGMLDSNGDIVAAGYMLRKSINRMSVVLTKFDLDGNYILTRSYYGTLHPTYDHYGYAIAEVSPPEGSNYYLVAGNLATPGDDSYVLLLAVYPDLAVRSALAIGDSGQHSVGRALASTPDGFVLAGETGGRLFVSKRYSDLSGWEWQEKMELVASGYSVLLNHQGKFRVAGVSPSGSSGIARFNSDGSACSWVGIAAGTGYALAEGADPNYPYPLWFAGAAESWGAGGKDGLLAKCEADGTTCNTQFVQLNCADWRPAQSDVLYAMSGWTPIVDPNEPWGASPMQPPLTVHALCDNECVPGACCLVDGSCTVVTAAACTQLAGSWLGPGTSCTRNPCTQPGACCYDNGSCTVVTAAACTQAAGTWLGAGTSCLPNPCPQPGACTYDCPPAYCEQSWDFVCALSGGRFNANTQCANVTPAPGAQLGACCEDNGGCSMTTCGNCLPAKRACCFGETCEMLTSIECGQQAGAEKGAGSTCSPTNPCRNYCRGDLNCDGTINFKDINPFVLRLSNPSGYFAAYPGCDDRNGDINCDGVVNFKDINPFVALLSLNPRPICPCVCPEPEPTPRAQGSYWGGPYSTCNPSDPNTYGCCTVVAANPKENESQNCLAPDIFNGGCDTNPPAFRPAIPALPYTVYGESGTFSGHRDTDWYEYVSSRWVAFAITVRAEFDPLVRIVAAGSDPGAPCTESADVAEPVSGIKCTDVELRSGMLGPGKYWFVVAPSAFNGVACGADYKLTVVEIPCPNVCTDPAFQPNLSEPTEACPNPGDTIDGGCDAGAPYHTLPITIDTALAFDYCAHTGGWFTDPNDPNTFHRDYDWYEFTVDPNGSASQRWFVYLFGSAPMTWEIWPSNNCAAGAIEGLDMPPCYYNAVQPAQCYPKATTYWLRVYPTDSTVACQDPYYLAMFNASGCAACNPSCGGVSNPDNPCDDVNDFDTNEGCNGDSAGVVHPTHFLNYTVGTMYCGQVYAKLFPNGNGYYDPDWFKFTWATTGNVRVKLWNQFPAFVAIWNAGADPNNPCVNVNNSSPPVSYQTSAAGWKNWVKTCSGTTAQFLDVSALPAGNYVGAVWPIDFFGNVLTKYYPCSSGRNQYKIQVVTN